MVLSNKRITRALIRLHVCTGWSAPLLFANPRRQVFSRQGPNDNSLFIRIWHQRGHPCPLDTFLVPRRCFFVDHLCYFCLVLLCLLFIDALWSPAGKGLTSWLLFVISNSKKEAPIVGFCVLLCITLCPFWFCNHLDG